MLFKSLSLRAQLIALALAAVVLALATAGVLLFFLDRAQAREQLTQELTSTARLLANRSSAALVFLDDISANENLQALRGLSQVGLVCLYDLEPRLFASYAQVGDSAERCKALGPASGDPANIVRVEVPVIGKDFAVGRLQLLSTDKPLKDRMWAQLASLALALGSAFALASLMALRLQRAIVQPIAQVRDVAAAVISTRDFGLRAPDLGRHEVGRLAGDFNAMLQTIQRQNLELAQREDYTRRLFHDSPIAQLVLDAGGGNFVDCNQAAAAIHGYRDPSELIGRTTMDISAAHQANGVDSATAIEYAANRLRNEGIVSGEWRFKRPDGQRWDGMLYSTHFTRDGRELIHIGIQDITQRKQAEAALGQLNQDLENRVSARTAELSAALDTLKHAQSELLQKDKLASLGALVAGVAHELNTPLGNSILVASSLELAAKSLGDGMQSGRLTKSGAAGMIDQLVQGTTLLTRNLERASALIVNFKQVAVDQTSEHRRKFALARMLQEVVETLQPQFKHTPHTVRVEAPEGIEMDSYPGPLGQVITNLVMNGLLHAFDKSRPGTLLIQVVRLNSAVARLLVQDDGNGIAPEHLPKVFDPFFTTKLGQGGSGLGLNIVFNIVVSTLGGEIRVASEPGQGTTFTLDIPLQAPLRD